MEDWARRFELLRDEYRRDDGSKWTGAALERATGGIVSRTYVSEFARGKIKEPSFSKIVAMSDAMGIPLEAWRSREGEERW